MSMKRKLLLIPFVAALMLLTVSFVYAGDTASYIETEFNGVDLGSSVTMAGMVGDTVPVRVEFEAAKSLSEVRVKVRMEGHREEISASTERFDIEEDSTYSKLLNLELPSDADVWSETYTLYVEVSSRTDRTEREYDLRIQRNSYTLEILSVDYPSKVSAGEAVPISVVAKNNGYNRADDVFVKASIPALGISAKGYLGDLISVEDYEDDDDEEDSAYRNLYLNIPEVVDAGVYEMEVELYNEDTTVSETKLISVGESASSMVLAAAKNKDLNAGETVTYDLVIVNSGDQVKVYKINAVSGETLDVSVPSVVTVSPDSSETVQISVTADSSAEMGTYTFSVDVNGEQMVFGANVIGTEVSSSVVALTVVLVIIFVVLLVVLIVLLTRKEKPIDEVETSYY